MAAIGIVELSRHKHLLPGFSEIANSEQNNITIFTTCTTKSEIETQIHHSPQDLTWFCKPESRDLRDYIDSIQSQSIELDIIIILTVGGASGLPQLLLNKEFECKTAVIVHNGHGMYCHNPAQMVKFWSRVGQIASPLLTDKYRDLVTTKGAFQSEKRVIQQAEAGVVLYPKLKEHLSNRAPHPLYSIIPEFVRRQKLLIEEKELELVIPGRVSTDLRDYKVVFDAIKNLKPQDQDNLRIIILGHPKGDITSLRQGISEMQNKGVSIRTTLDDDWVSNEEFEGYIKNSDAILAPLKISRERWPGVDVEPERMGLTKTSGNIADAIRYSTPLILPDKFPVIDSLAPGVKTFDSDDELSMIISSLISVGERLALQEEMDSVTKQFTLSQQQSQFNSIVEDICE